MDLRDRQRAWLRKVMAATELSGTALAKKAGVAQTTITRFLGDPEYPNALSARTIEAIEQATGRRFLDEAPTGLDEGEGEPYIALPGDALEATVRELVGNRNGVDPWRLKSRSLESAGYLPGDILIVDMTISPRDGDIVCAQLYDWAAMTAQTVFRVWNKPFLIAKTMDASIPLMIALRPKEDAIKGVVVASLRGRALAA